MGMHPSNSGANMPKWWLVYGPPRVGTTYMTRCISLDSKRMISDWRLANLLELVARPLEFEHKKIKREYIRFDLNRALKDISNNLLESAHIGHGNYLDLVYKQAGMDILNCYESLVSMWGEPERKIFCYREPKGYMGSALKKFTHLTIKELRHNYIQCLSLYFILGGDVFEYKRDLTEYDYVQFLSPLCIEKDIESFNYSLNESENVTTKMLSAYLRIKKLGGYYEGNNCG